jgi:hypothetical protein
MRRSSGAPQDVVRISDVIVPADDDSPPQRAVAVTPIMVVQRAAPALNRHCPRQSIG